MIYIYTYPSISLASNPGAVATGMHTIVHPLQVQIFLLPPRTFNLFSQSRVSWS